MLRNLILWLSTKRRFTDAVARQGMRRGFARRFVAGETLSDALAASAELARTGYRVTLNHLGENVATSDEARLSRDSYISTLENLRAAGIDGNVSIKLTHLGLDLDRELCLSLAREIAARAKEIGATIEMDMEGSGYTAATIEIYADVQRRSGNAGLAIQAYLRRSLDDLERLAPLNPKIRLVKGAYREPPSIAFQHKHEVDSNYRRLLDRACMRDAHGQITVAIATHDAQLIAYAEEILARNTIPQGRYEFQMLLGIRRDLQSRVHAASHPLRIYVPWGTAWVPYFMRRLAERPANTLFVLRSLFSEKQTAR